MKKKAGIVLCITGIVLVIIAVIMLFIIPGHQDEQVNDNEDITEEMQEIKDGEEIDTTTGYQEETKQETSQEQTASNTDNKIQSSTELLPHAINPDVYKWPCGNERYQDWDEPRQVTEFAKYKEYYEEMAQEFSEYEGKDVEFSADEDRLYFYECLNEGIKVGICF